MFLLFYENILGHNFKKLTELDVIEYSIMTFAHNTEYDDFYCSKCSVFLTRHRTREKNAFDIFFNNDYIEPLLSCDEMIIKKILE